MRDLIQLAKAGGSFYIIGSRGSGYSLRTVPTFRRWRRQSATPAAYNRQKEGEKMYYVRDYYTQEIIGIFDNYEGALSLAKKTLDSEVVDENDNYYYSNVELPF